MKAINLFITLILFSIGTFAQTGTLKGIVKDKSTGFPLSFVNVVLEQSGNIVAGVASDIDGTYLIRSLKPGEYLIKVSCLGYVDFMKLNLKIVADKVNEFNIDLDQKVEMLDEVQVVRHTPVLVDKESVRARYDYTPINSAELKRSAPLSINQTNYSGDYSVKDVDWNTENYDVINENKFHDVINDPLSTFSIDVDKASYSNVRRFLSSNQKPPIDAVRLEEMINYFDYDYPNPTGEHPFSINLEMNSCPWNSEHDLLLIGLQGKMPDTEEIPASNLVFLIDVSGSMNTSNKLPLLVQSFKILVEKLRPHDRVAIVVYAGAAGLVLNSTSGKNKEKIISSLDQLRAGGSTAGGAGIRLAYNVAMENFIEGGNNRVILATDGDFNIGESSDAGMVRLIEEKRESGVYLSILGFGMGNYKDSKMEQISNAGNGNYSYIDNILEAKKVFGFELWGTLFTIAKDVKIQIEFNPSQVKAYRLIGYENRMLNKEDFNDDKKDAGDIGAGHTVTALYEIIKTDSKEPVNSIDQLEYQIPNTVASNDLMTVKLRYKDPDGSVSKLIKKKVKENQIRTNKPSENFMFASSVAGFGMLLRDSEFKGKLKYSDVLKLASQSKGKDTNGYRSEFIKMIEAAELLN